ncbi:MAG: response regulator [Actinomycetota bacterium]
MTTVDDPGPVPGDAEWAEVTILLVEDNPLDARATVRAAQKLGVGPQVEVVTDGQAALERLRAERSTQQPIGLVLLDLSLPGKDGHDVLDEIRADDELCTTPVVILTSSHESVDVQGAYQRGANAYVIKPTGLDDWFRTMATIREFWLSLAVLPGP